METKFGFLKLMRVLTPLVFILNGCGGGGGEGSSTPPVSDTPPPPPVNEAPTANAGSDMSVQEGDPVILGGSGSDPEGDEILYLWEQVTGPSVTFDDPTLANAKFVAPFVQGTKELGFDLTVYDPEGLEDTDSITITVYSNFLGCNPVSPPAELGLDPFYEKYCDANGIPVVASGLVDDRALEWAAYQARRMTGYRIDILEEMKRNNTRLAIMSESEVLTDLPEYSDLYEVFPGTDWDRIRGIGATMSRPVSVAPEGNVLCWQSDRWRGLFSTLAHEFPGHALANMGAKPDPMWNQRLIDTYDAAMASGLWVNRHSSTNPDEYWAIGVGAWFDMILDSSDDPDFIIISTRSELANYDAGLYQLILELLPEIDVPICP